MNVHLAAAFVLTVFVVVPAAGQTAGPMRPTAEQITLADAEVRRLVALRALVERERLSNVNGHQGRRRLHQPATPS